MQELLSKISQGFASIKIEEQFKESALKWLEKWLSDPLYQGDIPQLEYWVEQEKWDQILDCFFQMTPFGTAGRRGLVGIGPNRINRITLMLAAQGHAQYLLKKFGDEAKTRGVVISRDVRQYLEEGVYDPARPNPVYGLSCEDLALAAASVYNGNGIKVMYFTQPTPTPEMSYIVRQKHAVAGDMFSASHNPPEHNGLKVVDELGGQMLPPFDEALVNVVVNEVQEIKEMPLAEAKAAGLFTELTPEDHEAYLNAALSADVGDYLGAKIYFSPFHATALNSAYPVLKKLGFDVLLDPDSSKYDPRFSSIIYNIPNPEVLEAYENLIPHATEAGSDIIIVGDPDADRVGLMSKEQDGWRFYNGNEIYTLVAAYLLEEYQKLGKIHPNLLLVKTEVTTNMLTRLTQHYGIQIVGDILVGIKYVAAEMNRLQAEGRMSDFLIGGEESHGMVRGDYVRDKDTCVPAILLSRLASREKAQGRTLGQYFDKLNEELGLVSNYVTEIRLLGADGMSKIAKIQNELRAQKPQKFGRFAIQSMKDFWDGKRFVSESDKVARNFLVFYMEQLPGYSSIRVSVRPSGTEPKTKIYFELCCEPTPGKPLVEDRADAERLTGEMEKEVLKYLYKLIGVDFPDRGFLLFVMLPVDLKLKYFEIEPQIEALVDVPDPAERKDKLDKLISFLGVNPIPKFEKAFIAKNGVGVMEYLKLAVTE